MSQAVAFSKGIIKKYQKKVKKNENGRLDNTTKYCKFVKCQLDINTIYRTVEL